MWHHHFPFEPRPFPVRETRRKHTEPITMSVYKPCITHLINPKCIFDALKSLFVRKWILSLTLTFWDYRSGLPQFWSVSWEWDPKINFLTHWTFNAAVTTYKLYSLQLMSTLSITITSVFDDTQAFIKIIKYLNKWSETTLRKCYFSWGKPFAINKRIGDIKLMTTKWENTSVWYPGGWGSAGWIRISLDQFGSHGQISLCKRL